MAHALIVDGDCKTAQLLEKVAQTERFSTRSADSLREARLEIGRRHPDVVLTDIRLPDGKGVELIRHIAAPASTLFVVSGQPIVDNAVDALRAGAADYLAKPVDVERVQNILRRALGKSADRIERALPFSRMVGTSACMQQLYDRLQRVAPTSASVLLVGESACIAGALPRMRPKRTRPLRSSGAPRPAADRSRGRVAERRSRARTRSGSKGFTR